MSEQAGISVFDRISEVSGRVIAWLTLAMVIITAIIVVMRKLFDVGFIWMQESVIWMHAVVFMLGAAYTLLHEDHVRVDVFYRNMSETKKAIVDALGVLLFLLPLCVFLLLKSWDFAAASWSIGEASRESGGMPYPFVPILKSVLVIMPLMLMIQGASLLRRSINVLRGR